MSAPRDHLGDVCCFTTCQAPQGVGTWVSINGAALPVCEGHWLGNLDREIRHLRAENERLTDALHRRRAHPDYEYATTTCGRKAGPASTPEGDGWEDNVWGGAYHTCWERFEYHEEHYWRRRKPSESVGDAS